MSKKARNTTTRNDNISGTKLPTNPLDHVKSDDAIQRRIVTGVLESYNGNYDVLAEMVQNSVDALEDAALLDLKLPLKLQVHINLKENTLSVLDTGTGMTRSQAISAFAPNVSFKNDLGLLKKRGSKFSYRGYKGVGLTFLAYGTDDITLHTKPQDGQLTKGRMQYARTWAHGERADPALIVEDEGPSPLVEYARGTFVRIRLSQNTRPKKLSAIATELEVWKVILRTRTAIGQVLLNQSAPFKIEVDLLVTDLDGVNHSSSVEPSFLLPHLVQRQPPFRFLDIPAYYEEHSERTTIQVDSRRQDGIHLDTGENRLVEEKSWA